jgi:hypothetical protein
MHHQALARLHEYFIRKEAAYAFIHGRKDQEVKQHLLVGGSSSLRDASNQVLNLEDTKTAIIST